MYICIYVYVYMIKLENSKGEKNNLLRTGDDPRLHVPNY